MKNKTLMLYAFIIMLCFCFAQCKKTNTPDPGEQLPPETQTGAFTFGCKVDGKIYTAKGKGGLLSNESVWYGYYSDSSIIISVSNSISKFNFRAEFKYLGQVGLYELKEYPYEGIFNDNSNGTIPGTSNTYGTNNLNIGKINLKYFTPTIGSALAGTFDIYAKNQNGKIIHITEGRFDIGF